MTQHVSSADGTRLAVYDLGAPPEQADAPVLVAVHGYPDNHAVWDGVAAALADTFRVVSYDVRGAGGSDKPAQRDAYRIERLVEDLRAVLDTVSPERPVHLLAHDWGSIQGWAALSEPALAGRIASYTSISGPSLDHAAVWLRAAKHHPGAAAKQLAESYYTALFQMPKAPEALIRHGVLDRLLGAAAPLGRSSLAVPHHVTRTQADKINGLELYRANFPRHMGHPRPAPVDVPVQVIAPRHDPYVSVALQTQAPRPWARTLRTRVVSGGHWVIGDRPDVIARLVREFTTAVDAGAGTADPPRTGEFGGKLVVVTGGARGIGRATALEFARNGADIVIADVNDVAAKETAREIEALGVSAAAYHLDVSDAEEWEQFAERVRATHGVPDIVVNNAGIGMGGPVLATTVPDWQRILGINLWGVIHGCRLFGRQQVERGMGGQIINVASAAAFTPSRTLPAYATTKAAVLMLTQCLRAELAREGIRVTAICPGFVDSDIARSTVYVGVDDAGQDQLREHAAASYRRRNYTPERVARHIVKAARRNTPVAAISPEAKLFRAVGRFTPALSRALARLDLNKL